jgi:hypothetical protein
MRGARDETRVTSAQDAAQLILKRTPIGSNQEDYDVLSDGVVVGHIMRATARRGVRNAVDVDAGLRPPSRFFDAFVTAGSDRSDTARPHPDVIGTLLGPSDASAAVSTCGKDRARPRCLTPGKARRDHLT